GYWVAAWVTTAVFAAGSVGLFLLSRRSFSPRGQTWLGIAALAFDTAAISAFVLDYSWQTGSPIRQLIYLPLAEAALRYSLAGPLLVVVATVPVLIAFELLRPGPGGVKASFITFQVGAEVILGLIVGWLVRRLDLEAARAQARAREAEELRDALGRRVDVLEAANRCARALGSSLELDQAFGAFVRELRGLLPFDRTALILVEHDRAEVIAT